MTWKKETNKNPFALEAILARGNSVQGYFSNHPYVLVIFCLRKKTGTREKVLKLQFSYPYFVGLISTPAMARNLFRKSESYVTHGCSREIGFGGKFRSAFVAGTVNLLSIVERKRRTDPSDVIVVFYYNFKFIQRWLLLWGVDFLQDMRVFEGFLNTFAFLSDFVCWTFNNACRFIRRGIFMLW